MHWWAMSNRENGKSLHMMRYHRNPKLASAPYAYIASLGKPKRIESAVELYRSIAVAMIIILDLRFVGLFFTKR